MAAFGGASRATNDGFGEHVAAIRFSTFRARFGGEAVLTRGFPVIDLQAAGGLYDSLTLEIHVDLAGPAFSSLTAAQKSSELSAGGDEPSTSTITTIRDIVASFKPG